MNLSGRKVMLIGLAKTGVSVVKYLDKLGAKIVVNDSKSEEAFVEILDELKSIEGITYIFGRNPEDIDDLDMVVVSPGVPLDLPFIENLKEAGVEIIGEVELAYRLSKNPTFVGITGTNGKTTTTSLVGEIFKRAEKDTFIAGNIGAPVIDTVGKADEDSYIITELSSFQLESISEFRPRVSAILNITEDHLNRHHTMENYADAKANIFLNQDKNDFAVFNYDDELTRQTAEKCKAKKVFFSRKEKVDGGVYLDGNNNIIIDIDEKIEFLNKGEISLPGNHNLENCMAAIAISYVCGIDLEVIKDTLRTFEGVEHRQEYVRTLDGVRYVNDSKGTNPDSSIKALESYDCPVVLIAGGYDKGSNFDEFMEVAKNNVKSLILLGVTASQIEKSARNKGIDDIHLVKDMEEAVKVSHQLAKEGEIVLLSPACASWDMYKSFEVRGVDFKDNVNNLK
ncbi:MAG: UDP-N-acetylmuramoyl-L-alanine--D-glutamate ligase [Clostridioides sp.]|jgi:UDP-N-acetylmuramoylalanine--D-glutamate ligase|nr:UDP-N-acetylmuramoyl-L-alanine--D-glutamate ligase [Clostridioides sp.]